MTPVNHHPTPNRGGTNEFHTKRQDTPGFVLATRDSAASKRKPCGHGGFRAIHDTARPERRK